MTPLPQIIYQDDKETPPYAGPENRGRDREQLSDEMQAVVDVMCKRLSCEDNCVIPKDARPHIGHLFGAIKDIGGGSVPKGINEARDQFKDTKERDVARKDRNKKILDTVYILVIVTIIGLIGMGIVAKIKAGM